ncbi:MAG: 4Fe-4S dicluster domain-containing protein [Candidatus Njordarchaeales archaeon]
MWRINVLEERCKGCGLCIYVCAPKVLELSPDKINLMGFHPVTPAHPEKCLGCRMCEYICPEFAIFLTKSKEKEAEAHARIS